MLTRRGQLVDDAARLGSAQARDEFGGLTPFILNVVSVPLLVLVVAGAVLVGLLRRRWSIAIGAIVVLGAANLTTQVLKAVLQRPAEDAASLTLNSLPSGHVTVAASIAATALLVVPVRWRPVIAFLGAVFTALMGVATMVGTDIGAWHRASDVIAAMFLTSMWYFAVEAVLAAVAGEDATSGRARGLPAGVMKAVLRILAVVGGLAAGLGIGALVATAARAPIESDLGFRIAFAGAVAGVVAVACFTQAMMLRLRPHHPRAMPQDGGHAAEHVR